jgi:hypothetical protein
MKMDHTRIQQRSRDLRTGVWSSWSQCQEQAEGAAALAILRSQGELFGTLTLTESAGVECEEYRLDPMVRAQILEHSEKKMVRTSDLHPVADAE